MSLQTLVDMLNKQKLVDSMVQSQQMHKHDMVESLLKKQHDVELQNFIAKQSATELGSYLDVLPLEDAQKLWRMLPKERENDVLWEYQMSAAQTLQGTDNLILKTAKSMCTNWSMASSKTCPSQAAKT